MTQDELLEAIPGSDPLDELTLLAMRQAGVPIPNPRAWIPHEPTERQSLFLSLEQLEAFYGGAAGGGKSDALLMAALQFVDIPGYAAIIFRRTLADLRLPEALMARSHEWLDRTPASWSGSDMQWRFPGGAVLQFGYLDNENDKYRYQSSAYQYIAFDELTHFNEDQYRFLFSRLRRLKTANVPLRMRSASNPGGRGAIWVKTRFIPDGFMPQDAEAIRTWTKAIQYDEDELLMIKALLADQEESAEWPTHRAFVPARMHDNPHLDKQAYLQSLFQLDRVTREQMLKGDWSIYVAGRQRFWGPAIEQFQPRMASYGQLRVTRDAFGTETVRFFATPDEQPLAIWCPPNPYRTYAASADTAEGIDLAEPGSSSADPDFAVAKIRDADSGEECARIRGRLTEAVFGEMLYALLLWYNSPFLVPEVKGGYGRATLNKLLDLGYPSELIFNRHQQGELQGLPPHKGTISYHDLGWNTGESNRNLMISLLDDAITKHTIETYDAVTIDEYRHFCYDARGKAKAEPGWHDDCVIADCLCEVARIFARQMAPLRKRKGRIDQLPQKYGVGPMSPAERQAAIQEARRRNSIIKSRQ